MEGIRFIVGIACIVGIIWLQFYLSKKPSRWLGLLIPIICFAFSILAVSGLALFSTMTSTVSTVDGVVVNEVVEQQAMEEPSFVEMVITIVPVFVATNIPTIIFVGIYVSCRSKLKKSAELNKMSIHDLG